MNRGLSFCWFSSRNLFIETKWTADNGLGIWSVNLFYSFLCIIYKFLRVIVLVIKKVLK